MSIKEPVMYHTEHTDVTGDCPLSYLSFSVDYHVVFFCRTSC